MIRPLAILLLALPCTLSASYSVTKWDPEWDMHIREGSCWLTRGYSDESELTYPNAKPGDFTIFDSFRIQFIIPVKWDRPASEKYPVGQLNLFLYSSVEPKLSEQQWRIESVRIGGYEFAQLTENRNEVQLKYYRHFSLGHDESIETFNLLKDGVSPNLELKLSNGKIVKLAIPIHFSRFFPAWARMLSACAETDVT